MILSVFTQVGDTYSVAQAYALLIQQWPNDPYARQKAAGSLGGAVHGRTLIRVGNVYTRVR